jgi:lipoprotein-anchoring transpeptidase ErfK/SrfK
MGISAVLLAVSVAAGASQGIVDESSAPRVLDYGDRGAAVEILNDRLAEAGFNPDGGAVFGRKTRHAVYAFQKHHGIAVTGKFSPFMWDLLAEPIELPRRAQADRMEIDLGKQVLYVIENHQVARVLPISSGNGRSYLTETGGVDRAHTPEGVFRFQRRIRGMREAFLGIMYNPYYFFNGYAIHGSPSVPNYPASHGCVRVTMWDMDLLMKHHLKIGQTLYIYGKRTAPPDPVPERPAPRRV